MLVIRLTRIGKKNQPSFKIVVNDKRRSAKAGRVTEVLGFINPITKKKEVNADRLKYWLKNGAEPSDSVHNILVEMKLIEGTKVPLHIVKKAKVEAAPAGAPAAAAPVTAPSAAPEAPKA